MKKLTLLLGCMIYLHAQAQTVLTIPFEKVKDRSYTLSDTFKYGNKYVIEITNINRHVFSVVSKVEQEDFNTDLPAIFSGIKLPGFATLSLPGAQSAGGVEALAGGQKSKFDGNLDKINDQLHIIDTCYQHMKQVSRLSTTIAALLRDCDRTFADVKNELVTKTKKVLLDKNASNQAEQLKKDILSYIDNSRAAVKTMIPLVWTIPETGIIPNQAQVASVVETAIKLVEEMEKLEKENKIQMLIDNYNRINKSNFTYVSEPFVASKDEVKVNMVFKADTLLTCDYPNRLYVKKTIPTVGGIKVDFSTGVFASGRLKNNENYFFSQDLYYLTSAKDSITTIQQKDQGTQAILSIGALAHIYWRVKGKFNVALSPGVSTTVAFDSFLFHLGLSTTLGRQERLVLTVGTTLKESIILDRRYAVNVAKKRDEYPAEVPTIKVFPRGGAFFALTYNLSSLKKTKEE